MKLKFFAIGVGAALAFGACKKDDNGSSVQVDQQLQEAIHYLFHPCFDPMNHPLKFLKLCFSMP